MKEHAIEFVNAKKGPVHRLYCNRESFDIFGREFVNKMNNCPICGNRVEFNLDGDEDL